MIEQTKQLVESKYIISNGYQGDAKVRDSSDCHPIYPFVIRYHIRFVPLFVCWLFCSGHLWRH